MEDTYKTLAFPSSEILFKEKNSKFFGYAFPATTEEEIKTHLEILLQQFLLQIEAILLMRNHSYHFASSNLANIH